MQEGPDKDWRVTPADRWLIFRVRPQQEKLAANFLAQISIGYRYIETERHSRTLKGTVKRMVAALPAYLPFICPAGADALELRDRACECMFVKGLLTRRSDGVALELRPDWEDRLCLPRREEPAGPIDYVVTDQVRLTCGPLKGLLAQCVNIDDSGVTVEFAKPFLSTNRVLIRPEYAKRAA